jgi:hypothetical protein
MPFISQIQVVSLAAIILLVAYALWLARYRGLDGHLTVRWLIVLVATGFCIAFWQYLPPFRITSVMQERELLLMVTVGLFALVVFLMLDLLVRSSRHTAQIKRLTQELAIQRERIDRLEPVQPVARIEPRKPAEVQMPRARGSFVMSLAWLWIVLCLGFSAYDTFLYRTKYYPSALRKFLAAAYLE